MEQILQANLTEQDTEIVTIGQEEPDQVLDVKADSSTTQATPNIGTIGHLDPNKQLLILDSFGLMKDEFLRAIADAEARGVMHDPVEHYYPAPISPAIGGQHRPRSRGGEPSPGERVILNQIAKRLGVKR